MHCLEWVRPTSPRALVDPRCPLALSPAVSPRSNGGHQHVKRGSSGRSVGACFLTVTHFRKGGLECRVVADTHRRETLVFPLRGNSVVDRLQQVVQHFSKSRPAVRPFGPRTKLPPVQPKMEQVGHRFGPSATHQPAVWHPHSMVIHVLQVQSFVIHIVTNGAEPGSGCCEVWVSGKRVELRDRTAGYPLEGVLQKPTDR
jgi:hypothetical protein